MFDQLMSQAIIGGLDHSDLAELLSLDLITFCEYHELAKLIIRTTIY